MKKTIATNTKKPKQKHKKHTKTQQKNEHNPYSIEKEKPVSKINQSSPREQLSKIFSCLGRQAKIFSLCAQLIWLNQCYGL